MADAPNPSQSEHDANRLMLILLIVAILFPILLLLVFPVAIAFWLGLFIALILWVIAFRAVRRMEPATPDVRMLSPMEQPDSIRELMDIRLATEQSGVRIFRGPLRESAESAFAKLKMQFSGDIIPLLQQDERLGASILLVPKPIEEKQVQRKVQPWKHWLLFGLTLLTTTWMGAVHAGVDLSAHPPQFWVGLPYSLGLLAILGVHELGHYYAARRHRMDVTPPYFIPVPFALGTFGAFIRMRSPPEDRRSLFDMAVSGPLAGLVIAIPALFFGLKTSHVIATASDASQVMPAGTSAGSSILLVLIAKLSLGADFAFGSVLRLSPLAFAGWLGLFVTALNLLPIGQLDGGHIARSMFGHRIGNLISSIAVWSLVLLAIFVWPGLMFWALIVLLIARRGTPPLNDLTPISRRRLVLGYVTFAILALIIVPLPASLWRAAAAHCPYL